MTAVMPLQQFLVAAELPAEIANLKVGDLRIDSRQILRGDVFVCCGGEAFISAVVAAGASAVLLDSQSHFDASEVSVPVIKVENLSARAAELAAKRYPVSVPVIGVTGTNGKSTLVALIAQLLQCTTQEKIATIGTLGTGLWGEPYQKTGMTTPDIFTSYAAINRFEQQGASSVAMEVSSHGLNQGRVTGLPIKTAVFTNLSQDHLDYHGGFEAYRDAKQKLFKLSTVETAVINADDENAEFMVAAEHYPVLRFGIQSACDVRATNLHAFAEGMTFDVNTPWGSAQVRSPLLGVFNVYNLLAAICAAVVQGADFEKVIAAIPHLKNIAGRMQRLSGSCGLQVVVDFAHTPDALEQALQAVKAHTVGKLWVVFGCGGDRDKSKRALMGAIAEELADEVVLTSDNPRTEDPEVILEAIASGCKNTPWQFVSREEAIAYAVAHAEVGDCILVAGKGHETDQIIGSKIIPFSDVEVARNYLNIRSEGALQ